MTKDHLFKIQFPANPERLCLVRALVKRAAEVVGCHDDLPDKLVLAVNEACMNVIQHAYKGDYSGEIELEILNHENHLLFKIKDYADPIDLECVKHRDLDDLRPGGLGTHFIQEIMDECDRGHLEGGVGNYIEMKKKIG